MENAASVTYDNFGVMLKLLRKRSGLTQEQLAERLDVSRHTILGWESNRTHPQSKELVLKAARVLYLTDQETRQLLDASFTAPSLYWLVPYPRNPFFTGREETLAQLHTLLAAKQKVALTSWALSGLGGIGKTQLALEYAYRYALDYSAVIWINAETAEAIMGSYSTIAEALALPERQEADQQQLQAAVQRWLHAHSGWLLIWDNLEEPGLISRFLAVPHGAHLITTRLSTTGTLAQHLDLLPLPAEEALLFLLRRAKRLPANATLKQLAALAQQKPKTHTAAKALVRLLDGLPLALDQAGAYIESARCSIAKYLEQYQAQRGYMLDQRGASAGHPESVTTTFRLALSRLEPAQTATDFLRLCAFLAPDAIPEDLLATGVDLGENLIALATDEIALDEAFRTLLQLALIQRQPETATFSIHRLVQAVQQECLPEDERRLWAERAVRLISAAFPDSNDYATWGRCRQLLPHALVCADHIKKWDFAFSEAARLLNEAGHYLRQRVRLQEALPLLEHALKIRQQTLDPHHPDLATSLNNVGAGYLGMGQFQQALSLFKQALAIREQLFGPDHPEVARSLNNLAFIYRTLGQMEEGKRQFLRAIAILEQAPGYGPDHPDVATILRNLADLYLYQSQYQEAAPHISQALAIRERALGSDHPDVANSLTALAMIYDIERRYEDAFALHNRALKIREKAFGLHHPDVAYSLSGLASIYQHMGQYEEALSLLKRALKIWEQAQGPEHPDTAQCLKQLADFFTKQGQYEQAESLYQQAFMIYENQLGPDHLLTAAVFIGLAALRVEQRQQEDARLLYQKALKIQEHRLGPEHPETIQTRALYNQLLSSLHAKHPARRRGNQDHLS